MSDRGRLAQDDILIDNGLTKPADALPDVDATIHPLWSAFVSFWRERRFLWRCVVTCAVLGTILAFILPKEYQSTARLMPPEQNDMKTMMLAAISGKGGDGLGSLAGDLLGAKTSGALFVGMLRSETVQQRLVDRFDLRKVYWKKLWVDARHKLSQRSAISEDRKTGIISVTVTDRERWRAQALANAYVEELDRVVAASSVSSARRERQFLEKRLITVKAELDKASRDLANFSQKTGAIDIKEQGKAMVQAAASLQGELIAAQSTLSGLQQIYTNENYRIRALKARIEEIKKELNKMGGSSKGTISDFKQESSELYPSIRELPVLGVTWTDLYRKAMIEEAVFEALTKQLEMAKVQEAREIPTVKVLDVPELPEKRSGPPRLLIIVGASFLGLLLGCSYSMSQKFWNEWEESDPRKRFLAQVFGSILRAASRLPIASRFLPRLRMID